ncbi:MAG: hypothetical protein NUK65_13515, partial [Firmicutes bacterium]|nr:hypothetical protein [Bacillota bacterium]
MKNDINIWYMALEEINKKIIHKKYTFISVPNYIESYFLKDSKKAMQIYWKELLQRLHLASVTSLMRNFKWIEGIKFGIDSNNYIIFASSLRGYIEAFVDSYYS